MNFRDNKLIKTLVFTAICAANLFAALAHAANKKPEEPYIFGVLPALSTNQLIKSFAPVANLLSISLGRPVRIETAPDFKTFLSRIIDEKRYDIILPPPHFYLLTHTKANYEAIARADTEHMQAVIVVNQNSPLQSMEDLRGKKLSIIDSFALVALLVKQQLSQIPLHPGKDIELIETPTHDAALFAITNHTADAAAVIKVIYERSTANFLQNTRIIAKSDPVQTSPIAVAPWIPSDERERIQKTLVSPKNNYIFKHLKWSGMLQASTEDYRSLEWALPLLENER